ncbi:acyl-CoA dehydrogenase family protein [Streptomyces sp. NPDC002785]|uniref:acyl-CoA dehydrogenase family protein n=1 Tax=Streptomyces sp. NPDC002785 TaxID=3154543 RepID=UPI00332A281E
MQPLCVTTWIAPLQPALPGLGERELDELRTLETHLVQALTTHTGPPTSTDLLALRRHLAALRKPDAVPDLAPHALALTDALTAFLCGFYDLDLRDTVGTGHGRMILRHACEPVRRHWAARLAAGDLVGIAATERHGGSRLQEITTQATEHPGGGWLLNGEKCWVSRLTEASGFVVFFKDPAGELTAAVLDANTPGLQRQTIPPAGLGGWAWGNLSLTDVPLHPQDLLSTTGDGLRVFRRHFAHFRPLVAATALGTAAGAHTAVTANLTARLNTRLIRRLRDNALVTLGRTHAELNAALLHALGAATITAAGSPHSDIWSRGVKAHAVDTAHRTTAELSLLVGALAFQAHSPLAKARADLGGLLYADGIHDALQRSVGRTLTTTQPAQQPHPQAS